MALSSLELQHILPPGRLGRMKAKTTIKATSERQLLAQIRDKKADFHTQLYLLAFQTGKFSRPKKGHGIEKNQGKIRNKIAKAREKKTGNNVEPHFDAVNT
jgi:hypothetical protein